MLARGDTTVALLVRPNVTGGAILAVGRYTVAAMGPAMLLNGAVCAATLTDAAWLHLVLRFKGTQMRVSLNGRDAGCPVLAYAPFEGTRSPLVTPAGAAATAVYDRALSDAEVARTAAGSADACPPVDTSVSYPSVGDPLNVALGRTVSYSSPTPGRPALTDGNTTCAGLAAPASEAFPWVTLDLGATYQLSTITLWPRSDDDGPARRAVRSLRILAGLAPTGEANGSTLLNHNPVCQASFAALPAGGLSLPCPAVARYLTVQQVASDDPAREALELCEVGVFGVPAPELAPLQGAAATLNISGNCLAADAPAPAPPTPAGCTLSSSLGCASGVLAIASATASYGGCTADVTAAAATACNGNRQCAVGAALGPPCSSPDVFGVAPCGGGALNTCAGASTVTTCVSCVANASAPSPPPAVKPTPVAIALTSAAPSTADGQWCLQGGQALTVTILAPLPNDGGRLSWSAAGDGAQHIP